ncbi:FkbM family methyltransferase [Mucilaginibacter flavus]|uniref:FkbM family methyltransferase n=1 Tax=Mucilaginibacter flavus TaxID=931504 RepID=UPI0025B5759C|nr:FkbM family methyltransferase [Mucilaginibacter flavus]MDN3584403.1 FkbM family methyltransferase [Mucilaginibacter flavus]
MIFNREYYIDLPVPIKQELDMLFKRDAAITIFEIGACEGEDSIRYSNLFPNSNIFAFEPLPKNLQKIQHNIVKYQKDNITIVPLGLSDNCGISTFYVSSGTPEGQENNENWDFGNKSSSLLPPDKHIDVVKFIEFKQRIDVETITLDAFCQNKGINLVDFVHMDVQGAELMVLNGARNSISKMKAIWLEVSKITLYKGQPLINDIERFMSENNFVKIKDTVDDITGDQFYVSKTFFPGHHQMLSAIIPRDSRFERLADLKALWGKTKRKLSAVKRWFFK